MSDQFPTKSGAAREEYAEQLTNAQHGPWIEDPSYALASDLEVYSKVLRDPVAAHAIRYRKHLVAGSEWTVQPASESPSDQLAAKIVEDMLHALRGFEDARVRLASAIFRGSAYQFVEGRRAFAQLGGVAAAWWVPTRLVDVDRRRFRLSPEGWKLWSVERRCWEALEHPEWFVRSTFDDVESSLGYGRGLLDTLYRFQSLKTRTLQQAASACERFAEGFLIAKIANMRDGARAAGGTSSGASARAAAVIDLLKRHRARNFLAIDADDDLQMINGVGEGWALIESMLSYLDTNQVMAVLGSTLATMQSMDEVGSNAKAQEHANSTEALVQADRKRLSDDVTRDLIEGLFWPLNRYQIEAVAPGAKPPRFEITQQQREDPETAAKVLQILVTSGVSLRKDEVYDRFGYTQPKDGDEIVEGQAAAAPGTGGGFGSPAPTGGHGPLGPLDSFGGSRAWLESVSGGGGGAVA